MIILFAVTLLISLFLIPLGLPGLWLMLVAGGVLLWLAPVAPFGWLVLAGCASIAVVAEVLEMAMSAKYTKKYGGSTRGAWGALIGGLIGAVVGVPIPVIGSVIGAFAGGFAGALVAELSRGASAEGATRAATGATIGRAIATAFKVVAGCVIAAWLLAAALI
ncbi:MAG: DUF456 domain-containing protein [Gemmatimonadetes bacterium]|nr:DUF456 domain-containing protein [Gemmatimonadota bacterium]